MALTDKLTAVADAIRSKTGTTDPMTLDAMAAAVEGLEVGGGEDYLAQLCNGTLTEYSNSEITNIPAYIFRGSELDSINIPNVTTVGDYAFYQCYLDSCIAPSLVTIGSSAFYYSSFVSLSV